MEKALEELTRAPVRRTDEDFSVVWDGDLDALRSQIARTVVAPGLRRLLARLAARSDDEGRRR